MHVLWMYCSSTNGDSSCVHTTLTMQKVLGRLASGGNFRMWFQMSGLTQVVRDSLADSPADSQAEAPACPASMTSCRIPSCSLPCRWLAVPEGCLILTWWQPSVWLEYYNSSDPISRQDPEVMAALQDVAQNPVNIAKYQSNPKIMALVTKLSSKFGGAAPQP